MEFAIITLILIEIAFSYVSFREAKEQFTVLNNLETSSRATATTLASLQEITEQMNKATQEQAALSYEVALNVQINLPENELDITNEGRTPVTLWGMKLLDQSPLMQTRPSILAPGAPHSLSAEKIVTLAIQQMNTHRAASIPLVLFLRNEKSEEFVARYIFVNRTGYGPFSLQTHALSVTRATWSRKAE
jgi:hypothetical protein